jgi:hypothetical protein
MRGSTVSRVRYKKEPNERNVWRRNEGNCGGTVGPVVKTFQVREEEEGKREQSG